MEKFLRRFCSQEIQILIAKMEEDYGEFTDYRNNWLRLAETTRHMTRVELYCVTKAKKRAAGTYERQQYLARILQQQIAPVTPEQYEDNAFTSISMQQHNKYLQAAQQYQNQRNQIMNAMMQNQYGQQAQQYITQGFK